MWVKVVDVWFHGQIICCSCTDGVRCGVGLCWQFFRHSWPFTCGRNFGSHIKSCLFRLIRVEVRAYVTCWNLFRRGWSSGNFVWKPQDLVNSLNMDWVSFLGYIHVCCCALLCSLDIFSHLVPVLFVIFSWNSEPQVWFHYRVENISFFYKYLV